MTLTESHCVLDLKLKIKKKRFQPVDILNLSKDVSIIETPPYNSMRMKLHHSYFNHSYFNHSYVINFKLNVSNS